MDFVASPADFVAFVIPGTFKAELRTCISEKTRDVVELFK
jgi:hypothetical protein